MHVYVILFIATRVAFEFQPEFTAKYIRNLILTRWILLKYRKIAALAGLISALFCKMGNFC